MRKSRMATRRAIVFGSPRMSMIFPIENIESGIHRRDFRYRNITDLSPITFILPE
jgi:hypothetical protein